MFSIAKMQKSYQTTSRVLNPTFKKPLNIQFTTPKAPKPKFGAGLNLPQPTSIQESRFENSRTSLPAHDLVTALVERLDEIMTVTGEVFSKNEAFTSMIDVSFAPVQKHQNPWVNASVSAQVEHALNVGKSKNVGIMVLGGEASTLGNKMPLAKARATFNAIDPASVQTGALKPIPVAELTLTPKDTPINDAAKQWNSDLANFYKAVASRLGARDEKATLPNLAREASSRTRLINSNVYVTPQMLNKKQTGHGGITAAMALKDMDSLAKRFTMGYSHRLSAFSANYIDKYVGTDALQFDTTLDHVDEKGNIILSSRISKLDTKSQQAKGPIILVHAKLEPADSLQSKTPSLNPNLMTPEEQHRSQEAQDWAKLHP